MKTDMIKYRKELVEILSTAKDKIDELEEEFETYLDFLHDENKEMALETWNDKHDELITLQEAIREWMDTAGNIK